MQKEKYYIVMADIIDSSDKAGGSLMHHFKEMVNSVNERLSEKIISPFTITLGDEFQGIVNSLQTAVEVIFLMDEILLEAEEAYKLRFVINFGVIDTPINKEQAYEMLGEGLTVARRSLGELKSAESDILVAGLDQPLEENLNMAFQLYRMIYDDWGTKDRPIARSFLKEPDYKKVAEIYSKDISTMWRRQKSLKIDEFNIARKLILNLSS
ncbi:SatD family protein [Fulvivirga maritima]|uniref:SatD family protein n=1 Tax=Fulvivirga maritima TaxID=2904247 RepID=UPI001F2AD12F|nr:SatD family protein [Fulvivirga maritima]UII25564.1 SatD family protein [Fulvivirga maritima]